MKGLVKLLIKCTNKGLRALGILAMIMLVLSFTDLPYYAYHHLAATELSLNEDPKYIVVLGASGMPSEEGLMRCYFAATAGVEFRDAKILIAHSSAKTEDNEQVELMAQELIIRGIDSTRINTFSQGYNTHSQILELAENLKNKDAPILLVSSPQHMRRSIACFNKLGFGRIGSAPSFGTPIQERGLISTRNTKDPGLGLRYNMWSYLTYEIIVLREYCAMAYYKLRGWI